MSNYNRELSQLARYVTVDDSSQRITFTSNDVSFGVGTTEVIFSSDTFTLGVLNQPTVIIDNEKTQINGNVNVGVSSTTNYIAFRGTSYDGVEPRFGALKPEDNYKYYTHSFIAERIYDYRYLNYTVAGVADTTPGGQKSELLFFKGNDPYPFPGENREPGADRIRLAASEHQFDTYFQPLNPDELSTIEKAANSAKLQPRMTITSRGDVGIGVTFPQARLHISGVGVNTTPGVTLRVDGNVNVGFSSTSNYLAFRGLFADGVDGNPANPESEVHRPNSHCYIGERIYDFNDETPLDPYFDGQKSELLFFKGNDSYPYPGGTRAPGPDRIRLCAAALRFDTYNVPVNPGPNNFDSAGRLTQNQIPRLYIESEGNIAIAATDPTHKLDINANSFRVRSSKTPATAGAAGTTGEVAWDANYIYVCTATNTWKRAALSTW